MVSPQNIHCLALNYTGVGDQTQSPLYFVKSLSSLCATGSKIRYPNNSNSFWTEVELTIVISEDCFEITPEEASGFIEGYIVGADLTCTNIYNRDHHLGFSKSRENYCPVSSSIVKNKPSEKATLITEINGKITQAGKIEEMRLNPYESLSFVSNITMLKKGDILLTGTPKGVENNLLKSGDKVRQLIESIGEIVYEIW